jgi:ketosteroid isomerase-like protein
MRPSADVREAMLRFYDRLSAGDVASFDQLVSQEPATLVIGTAPGEWVTERDRMRFGFETEGVRMQPARPAGYEEGSMGWVVDEPRFFFPDGSSMKTRLTAVLHREDGAWRLVHMHVSVGVPDDEVAALQQRWSTAS